MKLSSNGISIVFSPAPDITAYEVARSMMLMSGAMAYQEIHDIILKEGLGRHFGIYYKNWRGKRTVIL